MLDELKGLENGYTLQQLEDKVGKQIEKRKKEIKKIRDSKEPAMNVEGQKEYEIDKIEKVFDDNIKKIEAQYNVQGQEIIQELDQKAATSQIKPSTLDKELAEGTVSDFLFSFSLAMDDAKKGEEIRILSEAIGGMTAEQKVAVRRAFPQIMQQAKGESTIVKGDLRGIGHSLSDIKTVEELTLDAAKQDIASGAIAKYRGVLIAQKTSADRRNRGGDNLSAFNYDVEYKTI